MGKQKILLPGILTYRLTPGRVLPAFAACLAVLAACAVGASGPYTGQLQPVAGTCDPPSRALLTIDDTFVHFTPRDGVITLDGTLARDGAIHAELISQGADHRPFHQRLTANLNADRITGTFETPRCRYALTLARK